MNREYYVYVVTNQRNGTLYIGVTNNLNRRIFEHKNGKIKGFTKKYALDKLVYYESTTDISAALAREKRLKKTGRKGKLALIEKMNPLWEDLPAF